jgi:catecholate siderophore receptor
MYVRPISLAALACALASPAIASDGVAPAAVDLESAAAERDQEIIVEGIRIRDPRRTSTATRTDTALLSVPQALTIVTEEQIDDQAFRSIGELLRFVPGTSVGQGEGHRDQITIRGNSSTADFFIDGLRDDIQYYRPLYNLERVEVLRGPNAMIFGRGGGGGVINRVTKVPLGRSLIAGTASVDSFGAWYADLDLNQPLGSGAAVRLNGVYEEFDNHRDFYEGRLIALNPSARFDFGAATSLILSYEHVDDSRVVDRGVPAAFAGTIANRAGPLAGHRDTFFGDPAVNRTDFNGDIVRATLQHRFSDALSVTSRLLYADYDKDYRNVFSATAIETVGGVPRVGLEAYRDAFQRENLFSQTDLVFRTNTGAVEHTILAGVEFGLQDSANQRENGYFPSGARRIFAPLAGQLTVPAVEFRTGAANGQRSTVSEAEVLAFYAQDQLRLGPVELVAGLRYDRFDIAVTDLITGIATARTDTLWSPRLGLILHPVENLSLYASFSRSYLPQSGDQFNSLDVTGATLEPERFDNYEVGARFEPQEGLMVSAALYQLDRTNTRAPGPTPGTVVQTGEQRSRGVELEASGRIRPNWFLTAGYAYQEAEILTATTACNPAVRTCEVPLVPRHTASAWTRYDFSPAFGVGLGVRHQSESFASISNAVVLPAYTRVDAGLFFRPAPQVQAQLNIENLLGEEYFPTAHNDNNISTGPPRSVRLTVRFGF